MQVQTELTGSDYPEERDIKTAVVEQTLKKTHRHFR
jgi:hypothetical protein